MTNFDDGWISSEFALPARNASNESRTVVVMTKSGYILSAFYEYGINAWVASGFPFVFGETVKSHPEITEPVVSWRKFPE